VPEAALRELDTGRFATAHARGQVIFRQGEPGRGLYCVARGTVGCRVSDGQGHDVLVRLVGPSETFGMEALVGPRVHTCDALALEDAVVCLVDKETYGAVSHAYPGVRRSMEERLAEEVRETRQRCLHLATLSVRQRVARALVSLRGRFGEVVGGRLEITLPLSRRDLASLVGASPETVSRAVGELAACGAASFSGRRVEVADLDLLLDEAGES
jgi:CRP/FNR family transcriptional regulator